MSQVNYPTSEDIKRVVRAAKKEAHEHARWIAHQLNKENPEKEHRAARSGCANFRYGYAASEIDPYAEWIESGLPWTGYPTVKFLKEWIERGSCATRVESGARLLWIEVEAFPVVIETITDPRSYHRLGKRVQSDLGPLWGPPSTRKLWVYKDKGGSS